MPAPTSFLSPVSAPLEVFAIYARKDNHLRKELDKHLSAMKRQGLIAAWHDSHIQAGTVWANEMTKHLERAHLILLLISPDFLASDDCYNVQMTQALARHEAGEICLLPLLLRPVDWKGTPFEKLACLPSNRVPVTKWANRDEAFVDVANGIRKVAEELSLSLSIDSLSTNLGATQGPQVQSLLLPPNIPDEPYYPLPGREQQLNQLLHVLQDARGPLALTIDGLGGLGKTALSIELVRKALRQGLFERVIGESAQLILFTGGEIIQVREATLDFEHLLDSLARQLGHWELSTLKLEEKKTFLIRHMRQHRYLLLIDNLETMENAHLLVARLRDFLGKTRAIITTRHKVRHDFVHTLSLQGLDQQDSLIFLTKDIEQRGVQQLRDVSRDKLIEIHHITGGAPLAMKLVAAQTRFLDVDLVLKKLQNAGSHLYSYLFSQSWRNLSPTAQRVLIYIGRTVITSVSWEELASVEIANHEDALVAAIDQLVASSLLDVSSTSGRARYSIHQLTRQFVNSDLPEMWRQQGLQ
ncbi:MAG: TIR domain-containing protein [Chloroflexi bacterium]|nr:MAG: TIR domain-containing protein [Chloroflexota bacterium]